MRNVLYKQSYNLLPCGNTISMPASFTRQISFEPAYGGLAPRGHKGKYRNR